MTMRHAQRALLILLERLFLDEDTITEDERAELECLHLSGGEVKEVFRVFLRTNFGQHEVEWADRKRLLALAYRLHLPEELVPAVTAQAA